MSQYPSSSWSEVLSAALVGTDRRPFVPGAAGPEAGDPAQELLRQAMVLTVPALTGAPPARHEGALPEPAPADGRPLISPLVQLRLRSLLDAYPKYLGEWLAAVQAAGLRLPSATMPALLDVGRTNTAMRPALAHVLGPRGQWLAGQNADWRYLRRESVGPLRPEDWDGPDPDARTAYANGLYAADPEAARALFTAAWPTLTATVKLSLLSVLGRHRTDADLPFVEGLAKDPSKQVREEAHAIEAQLKGRDQRAESRPAEAFTAEITRMATAEVPTHDIYRYAAPQAHRPWPLDAARVILAVLLEHSRERDTTAAGAAAEKRARGSDWAAGHLMGMLADCAPLELHPEAERVSQAQAAEIAAGRVHHLDFHELLSPLGFRADMHAELTAPADAPGQE
ncbi:DUF5691 domain-containing protein [Actinospica robiniae]|uniref:DUF5691 domain-containing protein n=1 Tax=Actinospica robiniae TaxID=304901 RepID=UPI000405A803|nr:DUF5691 domain-containing protein [Actinospica robiniae]